MRLVTASILLALALAGPAQAAVSFTDVENEVMCTVCGTPLNLSPQDAPFAMRQRAFIRRLIAQGRSKEQIKDALVAQYGEEVLAEPRGGGFDLAAWAVPIGGAALALALLLTAIGQWRRRSGGRETAPESRPALSPADARRLDEDLARYD